jgi:DNA repair protein RecO (recombination protein O)
MKFKTLGIVLNFIKYRDTSIIVRIYTEKRGLQSYVVNGVRSSRSKGRIALFQPLTLLDMVAYARDSDLNRLKEYRISEPISSIPFHVGKSAIAIFISELLSKTIREEEENLAMFDFIYQSILVLDHLDQHYSNFHLQFMLKMSRFLGFAIEKADNLRVDMQFPDDLDPIIDSLIKQPYENTIEINKNMRREILDVLEKFYRYHFHIQGEFKSIKVLTEVMN